MGVIKTVRGEDGRPYISLEDLIKEVEESKKYRNENMITNSHNDNFVDVVLKTLHNMEEEYYEKYLFKKK